MLGYYRHSIINLLSEVHEARINPFEDVQKWRNIQEKLIIKISSAEKKIRTLKEEKRKINLYRKNPLVRLTKEESIQEKSKIKQKENLIEQYRTLHNVYKSIGDAIAFTFLHKFDIKPQNFKQSPGFITEKIGFKLEKQIFRYAYKKGAIAILNDLTSVLRYCDITMITGDGFIPIEVKSSHNKNAKTERQKFNAEKLFKYLDEDITKGLYGIDGYMQRVQVGIPESDHITLINELIAKSKNEGFAFQLSEPGVLYFVAHKVPPTIVKTIEIFKQNRIHKPVAYFLNTMKFVEQGYYPFSLSLTNPENYIDFLEGKLVITIFIDTEIIRKIAKKFKFSVAQSDNPEYEYEFRNESKNPKLTSINISKHFFNRTILEFVSLEWILTVTFSSMSKAMMSKISNLRE